MTEGLRWVWEKLDVEEFGNTGYFSHGYVVEMNGTLGWWVWNQADRDFYRPADSMSEACSIAEQHSRAEILRAREELTAMGLVVDSGDRRLGVDGEPQIVWRMKTEEEKLAEKGMEQSEARALVELEAQMPATFRGMEIDLASLDGDNEA